jgi:ribonucleoside-triphosphate reductase
MTGPAKASNKKGAEILLGDKSFCNLCTTDLGKFNGRTGDLHRAIYLIARANYRQTCVNLDDGILQRTWHELNEFLRLTGVSLTGFVRWEHQHNAEELRKLRDMAQLGVDSMADELGLPRSKAVQAQKPEGTGSKIMDTTEGGHKPPGKYIFNKIRFSAFDPVVNLLKEANYDVMVDPYDSTGVLITFPVAFKDVEFEEVELSDGRIVEINTESAVDQLDRYKFIMDNYIPNHNASNTISYSPEEVPAMIAWLYENWDSYVGVSFLYRSDPTKTARDLGYPYLPQQVVTKEEHDEYVSKLSPVDINRGNSHDTVETEGCVGGVCPVR